MRYMRRISFLTLGAMLSAALSTAAVPSDMSGFSSADAARQVDLETRFDADISAAEIREWLQRMAAEPNQVGSPHDKANAEFELAKFREWGWDAAIETFQVLYPTPKEVLVEMTAPTHFKAKLAE